MYVLPVLSCNGLSPPLPGISCWIACMQWVFRSPYTCVDPSQYCLIKWEMIFCCYSLQIVPRLAIFISWQIPRFLCPFIVLVLLLFSLSDSSSLFVPLNFKKLEIMHGPLLWMTEIHSVLKPSCVPDVSRFMAHNLFVHEPFGMLVLLLLSLLLLLLLLEKQNVQFSLSSIG